MNRETLIPILLIFVRYGAVALVGKMGLDEAQGKSLLEALTNPVVLLALAGFIISLGSGLKAWVNLKRQALTAAAMTGPATSQEVKEMAKTSAPPLNTPATEVPQLQPKEPPKENPNVDEQK